MCSIAWIHHKSCFILSTIFSTSPNSTTHIHTEGNLQNYYIAYNKYISIKSKNPAGKVVLLSLTREVQDNITKIGIKWHQEEQYILKRKNFRIQQTWPKVDRKIMVSWVSCNEKYWCSNVSMYTNHWKLMCKNSKQLRRRSVCWKYLQWDAMKVYQIDSWDGRSVILWKHYVGLTFIP